MRISPRALERQTIIVSICSLMLLAVCVQTPRLIYVIDYILLAAKGAVSGVCVYYPHPGGQA